MTEQVRTMFAEIAPAYDRTNTVLSFGMHHRWRRRAVQLAQASRGGEVIDVACGTGDLAFEFRRAVGPKGRVVGVDFCGPMLDHGRAKMRENRLRVDFQEADALKLPFPDDSFDVAAIGFGIRNVDDPARCLKEMARVVRPGGRVVVLEFGQPDGALKWPYRAYSRVVIPLVGGLLTGRRRAYQYLPRTAAKFPAGPKFLEVMESTRRFSKVEGEPLTRGVAFVYVGVVDRRG